MTPSQREARLIIAQGYDIGVDAKMNIDLVRGIAAALTTRDERIAQAILAISDLQNRFDREREKRNKCEEELILLKQKHIVDANKKVEPDLAKRMYEALMLISQNCKWRKTEAEAFSYDYAKEAVAAYESSVGRGGV